MIKFDIPIARRLLAATVLAAAAGDFSGCNLPTVEAQEKGATASSVISDARGYGAKCNATSLPNGEKIQVHVVTNLGDYDPTDKKDTPIPGSLRFAVEQGGVIILAVPGEIRLKRELTISVPHTAIIGDKLPSPGLTLTGAGVIVKTHDVFLSNFKIRPGDFASKCELSNRDCITLWGREDGKWGEKDSVERIYIRKVSASFSTDEIFSTYRHVRDVTVEDFLAGLPLRYTGHADIDATKPPGTDNVHNFGILISAETKRISFIRTALVGYGHRGPRIKDGASAEFVNCFFGAWGPNDSDKFYAPAEKTPPKEGGTVRVVGCVWGGMPNLSSGGPLVNLGVKNNPPLIKLFWDDNSLMNLATGQVGPVLAGVDAKFLMGKDPVDAELAKFRPIASKDLRAGLVNKIGSRPANGAYDPVDRDVFDIMQKGAFPARWKFKGFPDTVQQGVTKLNGFPVNTYPWLSPVAGAAVPLNFPRGPNDTVRVKADAMSPLEDWLLKAMTPPIKK